jgi:flagellar P-ring protein precursor FlgI
MHRLLVVGLICAGAALGPGAGPGPAQPPPLPSAGGVRIKDITELEGQRSNQLIGVGLVVGLDGTGSKSPFTQQVAVDMLSRFNIVSKVTAGTPGDTPFKSGNIAAVTVTAELGPFARCGSRIDVTVAALDDSSSLQGGQLLMTPLSGADKCIYAVAQGALHLGGFTFGGVGGGAPGAGAQKNHPTAGRIAGGAIVEREVRGEVLCNGQLRLLLRQPDYTTSRAIAKAINTRYPNCAVTLDAGAVQVFVPKGMCPNVVSFISDIGALEVEPDVPARVVINERTGTIVAGQQVKIAAVAVAHGNLAIVTNNEPQVSQPLPYSRGKTVVVPRASVGVTEQGGSVQVLPPTVTVADLARALNALGATPRDLITIFHALKEAGALHAELVTAP